MSWPSPNNASALKERCRRPCRRWIMDGMVPRRSETGVGGVFIVEGGRFVPIGERTSDNGVRVRQKRLSRCVAAFPHLAGFLDGYGLAVANSRAAPAMPEMDGSDPPLSTVSIGSAGWADVHGHATPPGVAPVRYQSLREGPSNQFQGAAAQSSNRGNRMPRCSESALRRSPFPGRIPEGES